MDHPGYGDSPDAANLRASVQRRSIPVLIHYTIADHIESIFENGAILCRKSLEERDIPFEGHGWGYFGKEEEFADYVVCSFMPHWGMIAKEKKPLTLFEVDSNLIWRNGSIFCPGNSASNEFKLQGLVKASTHETFEKLFPSDMAGRPTNWQAEVLVKGAIEIRYFKRLVFATTEHRDHYIEKARAGFARSGLPSPALSIKCVVDISRFPPGGYVPPTLGT